MMRGQAKAKVNGENESWNIINTCVTVNQASFEVLLDSNNTTQTSHNPEEMVFTALETH